MSLPRTGRASRVKGLLYIGWENWQKVTVSKASAATNLGRESPSCAYTAGFPTALA